MILLDIDELEKARLCALLRRIAEGMNVTLEDKAVARKVARQIIIGLDTNETIRKG